MRADMSLQGGGVASLLYNETPEKYIRAICVAWNKLNANHPLQGCICFYDKYKKKANRTYSAGTYLLLRFGFITDACFASSLLETCCVGHNGKLKQSC